MSNVQKMQQKVFQCRKAIVWGLIMGVEIPLASKFISLKSVLYHIGVLPYSDVVYSLVATSLAGLVSLAVGPVSFTFLYRLIKREREKEKEKGFSHDRRKRFFFGWLSFLLIYSLLWSVCQENSLAAGLEDLLVGYVFSVLMVVSAFVLMISLRKFLVKIPLLEFKTDCDEYFALYCAVFWAALIVRQVIPGPIFHHT